MTSKHSLDRYVRQMRYPPLGEEGQRKLADSRALICGCGALGSVIANTLARAGVGHLRIVDRDFLELSNLQRQVLFDEEDVASGIPKAIAAAAKLRKINSQIGDRRLRRGQGMADDASSRAHQDRNRGDELGKLTPPPDQRISPRLRKVLDAYYRSMARGVSPYGDGRAAARIVEILRKDLLDSAP